MELNVEQGSLALRGTNKAVILLFFFDPVYLVFYSLCIPERLKPLESHLYAPFP
jgi:hypothetical protein